MSFQLTKPCRLGEVSWTRKDMMDEFSVFVERGIYTQRPVRASNRKNTGGTGFMHSFYMWFIIRMLDPEHIIESGALHGVGTWMLRQASPTAQLIVISPKTPKLYIDNATNSVYFTGDQFKDFSQINWNCLNINKAKTLVFFDDHQSGYRRMLESYARNFQHLMFDDNYLPFNGDHFSSKSACGSKEIVQYAQRLHIDELEFNDFRFYPDQKTYKLHTEDFLKIHDTFQQIVDVYAEMPPIWQGPSRFKYSLENLKTITEQPLLPYTGDAPTIYTITRFQNDLSSADEERRRYTWFPYIRLTSEEQKNLFWPRSVTAHNYSTPFAISNSACS